MCARSRIKQDTLIRYSRSGSRATRWRRVAGRQRIRLMLCWSSVARVWSGVRLRTLRGAALIVGVVVVVLWASWVVGVPAELAVAAAGLILSLALFYGTLLLVEEGRLMREASFAPGIAVTIGPNQYSAAVHELRICNYGSGPAHGVTFDLDGDLTIRGSAGTKSALSELRVLREGLRFLEPGGEYGTVVGGPDFLADNAPPDSGPATSVLLASRFRSGSGQVYESESWLELREFLWATPPLETIAQALKKRATP